MSFDPVDSFYVSNMNLALFKANMAMKSLINTYTFGTGFPTVPRSLPRTKVDKDYVVYYDSSHF
jgi:hypothetical protein